MNYEEFKNEFVEALQERLYERGNEVSISVNTVEKMNETYEAITVTPEGSNIGMNMNLGVFAEAYENGVGFDEIVDQVTHKVEDHLSNMWEVYEMPKMRTEVQHLEAQVQSGNKRFVRYAEGAALYSLGLHTFQEIAKEANAVYKVKRCVLVNLDMVNE